VGCHGEDDYDVDEDDFFHDVDGFGKDETIGKQRANLGKSIQYSSPEEYCFVCIDYPVCIAVDIVVDVFAIG
jgi:hypothetical protein